ncbi:MAG: cupin domain-containing protein [Candidatus Bathyarchaeota archaeon]|nr:cupin domain-containing protein [Candidatus Bathyarchaeota archaeon]
MKPKITKATEKERREAKSWPTWEKEESTFPWEYDEQEKCLILEGKAVVHTPEGSFEFGAGDYVVFPKGLRCTWEIKQKIRKHYNFG